MHQYLNCSILAMVSCHTQNKTQALTLATSPTEPTFVSLSNLSLTTLSLASPSLAMLAFSQVPE